MRRPHRDSDGNQNINSGFLLRVARNGVVEQLLVVSASVVFRKIRDVHAGVCWGSIESDNPDELVGLGYRSGLAKMSFPASACGHLGERVTVGLP